MSKSDVHVGIDSQCLSYLLDAIAGIGEPTDRLADERKALIRVWFYTPETYFVTSTVVEECEKIRNAERRAFHRSFIDTLFADPPIQDSKFIKVRASALLLAHPDKTSDCRVLAESEEMGLNVLLSYDQQFLRRLEKASPSVRLITPSAYWASLGIPCGAKPCTVPHHTNPLSTQTWWRW
jgi:hypothetical protein